MEHKYRFNFFTLFIICVLTSCFLFSCNRTIERSEYSNQKLIYEEAQSVIKDKLISPTSAQFPEFQTSFIKDNDEEIVYEEITYHTYLVTSYVDSQNIFGTMIRQKYQVIIGIPIDNENSGSIYYEILYLE